MVSKPLSLKLLCAALKNGAREANCPLETAAAAKTVQHSPETETQSATKDPVITAAKPKPSSGA